MIDGPRSLSSLESCQSMLFRRGLTHATSSSTSTPPKKSRTIDWKKEAGLLTSEKPLDESKREKIDINIKIGYTDDMERVLSIIKSVVNTDENILENPEPTYGIDKADEKNLNIKVLCWCKKNSFWDIMTMLLKSIKMRLFSNGISYKSVTKGA
jgi:hypothetical protein